MVARLLKLLLLLQLLVLGALAFAAYRYWHVQQVWLAVAIGAGTLLLARLLITGQNFLLNWYFGSETPIPFRLSVVQKVRMFGEEFGATMLHSSWTMARARAGRRMHGEAGTLPVLLVHGYGCNSGYWAQLIPRLDAQRISHASVDLEPVTADIEDSVPLLHAALENLCSEAGTAQAVIVAHSMGGLAARAYLRVHGDARVAHIITLGTPHHGTRMANLGVGRNALQMRRRGDVVSDWLRELAAAETAQQRALITSIYSHHDNIIAPQTSAALPGANNVAFGGVGHVALGRNSRILDAVMAELARLSKPHGSCVDTSAICR